MVTYLKINPNLSIRGVGQVLSLSKRFGLRVGLNRDRELPLSH